MKLIRILAIAPYKGMEKLISQIVQEMKDIFIHVIEEDFEDVIKQINCSNELSYDFIVTRIETIHLIEKVAPVPVIQIPLSEYDILHAIRIAKGFREKFCVVGYPNVVARIQTLCNLMELNIDVSVIEKTNETEARIRNLKKNGYSLIVGDANVVKTAQKMQLRGILIISGKESILTSLKECVKLYEIMEKTTNEKLSIKQIADNCPVHIFAYNQMQELLYTNLNRSAQREDAEAFIEILPSLVKKIIKDQEIRLIRKSSAYLWNIHGILTAPDLVCFYVRRLMRIGSHDSPLSIQDDFSGNTAIMQSFYLESASMKPVIQKAKQISKIDNPVMLTGEPGTGKNTLAYAIHSQSKLQNSTFLILNCQLITEKELHSLLEEDNSPLGENNIGIHFRDIHYLSLAAQDLLIAYIKETELHQRNRVIYTYTYSFKGKEEHNLLKYLKNERECDCFFLLIPPLREHKEDIPALATFYINELNSNYGKQIVGLEQRSMEILREYDWPENLGQFIRVIKDLVLNTEGAYIKADETMAVIAKEKQLTMRNEEFVSLQGNLSKITAGIIWQIYKEENMNQSRTAKRLGVSRSTMWRKLKEYHSGI